MGWLIRVVLKSKRSSEESQALSSWTGYHSLIRGLWYFLLDSLVEGNKTEKNRLYYLSWRVRNNYLAKHCLVHILEGQRSFSIVVPQSSWGATTISISVGLHLSLLFHDQAQVAASSLAVADSQLYFSNSQQMDSHALAILIPVSRRFLDLVQYETDTRIWNARRQIWEHRS